MNLFSELRLSNGSKIKNRIAKAAMEESLGEPNLTPSEKILNLYRKWADGGAGLIITGNVMIDRRAVTGPGGIALEDDKNLAQFAKWAQVIKQQGSQAWMQINHPGRQMPKSLSQTTIAPSAVPLKLGASSKVFAVPREMTPLEINDIIHRFVKTSQLAERAGFDGVEIHAAHGYLISQFLSPLSNKREDQWGGSIENRSRFLFEIIKQVRQSVSNHFTVAVKINSADFQRGGFNTDDAKYVVSQLNQLHVDLIEISGGSYEAPVMMGKSRDQSTLAREAYFLEFAKEISTVAKMPVMVTGGIRRKIIAEQVLDSGVSMVGIATALSINPSLPNDWLENKNVEAHLQNCNTRNKQLNTLTLMAMVRYQLNRLAQGKLTDPKVMPLKALLLDAIRLKWKSRAYKLQMEKL